jgi:hypothetical protein
MQHEQVKQDAASWNQEHCQNRIKLAGCTQQVIDIILEETMTPLKLGTPLELDLTPSWCKASQCCHC